MKRSLLLLMLIVSGYCYGQGEFQMYSNGLIYDQSTMAKLGRIVDSLNVRFRTCDLSHPYYSLPQGLAVHVSIHSKQALKMIKDEATYEQFAQRFPGSISQQKIWIIKSSYINYEDEPYIEYSSLPSGNDDEFNIRVKDIPANDKTSGWIINEDEEGAFYIQSLTRVELPANCARLVQYVDCMIDTTAQIYFPEAKGRIYQRVENKTKADEFVAWAEKFPDEPQMPDYDEKTDRKKLETLWRVYSSKHNEWDSLRLIHLDKEMAKPGYWKNLLVEATKESLSTGNSDERLEFYVTRYVSKEDALKLMRSRKVIGNCSQDQSPRYHAMNICKLAAETTKWDIFLRSHLDIMNDHFERMTDGSYAWGRRQTYLKELEMLDINAPDLLLGTCLRVQNVSDDHYTGTIWRVGRALAEVSDKDKLEAQLIAMMKNEKLDTYNRLLLAYVFSNYTSHLTDNDRKKGNELKLRETIKTMPVYIQDAWKKQ